MKKYYIHIYVVLAICLVAFVIGSFFDFEISDALTRVGGPNDKFGLSISVIGTVPGYGVVAFIGGGFLTLGLKREFSNIQKKEWNIFLTILMFVLALVCYGLSVYFTGREFFGVNGFQYPDIKEFYGYFVAAPVDLLLMFLGFVMTKNTTNKDLWIYLIAIAVAITVALVGCTIIKGILHRPRFRALGSYEGIDFRNWWQRFPEYKDYIELGAHKDNFKSFPSGHAGSCAVFMMFSLFLPVINEKYHRYVIPMFYAGLAWLLLVAFARIYVGAHFMSDVSFGALLTVISFFVLKVIVDNNKYLSGASEEEVAE